MDTLSPLRLMGEERKRKILEILEKDGRVTVEHLAREFGVSAVTARADLDDLAGAGTLVRSRGGAVRRSDSILDYPIAVKATLHRAEKQRIARAAVGLLRPEQTIILDSGTTTAQIARQIRGMRLRPLTVITNALNVAMNLHNVPEITVIMLGGILRRTSDSMVGPQAERTMGELNADHLLLGVDGLHPEIGLCTPDILEAQLNALMVRAAREVTAVADSSKLGRRGLSVIGKIDILNRLITDDKADPAIVAAIRARGVEVILT